MARLKGLRLAFSMLVMFTMLFPVSLAKAQGGPAEDKAGGLDDGVTISLRADGAPLPGGEARLILEATPYITAPEMRIRWVIPQGVQLVGSDVDSYSNAPVGETTRSERTLRFPAPGTYKIGVSVSLRFSPGESYGASGVLFFVIDPLGSRVTDKDPDAQRPVRHSRPGEVSISVTPSNIVSATPNEDPCFLVFAHVDRIERPVSAVGGYGDDIRIPVGGIAVEVRESDLLFDDSYGYLGTDDNGNLVGTFCDDDGLFDDELEIYLRIPAERGDPKVYVEDSSYIDEEYEFDTDYISSSGGDISFTINFGYDWSAIFNIVDAAWQAREFWVISGGSYDDETEIHWEPGYGDVKSYYDAYYNEITIADDPSDPDEWEESAIMHEWGHSADDYYSCDGAPGGDHKWNEIISSEMAWGEGYPDYYQSAVREYYGYPDANYYVSTDGNGDTTSHDLDFRFDCTKSVENECSIAAALWDLKRDIGHAALQTIYTSEEFTDIAYGRFDDTCDIQTYMSGWREYGLTIDGNVASDVHSNTGFTVYPSYLLSDSSTEAPRDGNLESTEYSPAEVYRWWKELTYVADNSASMTGPEFDAMKTLFAETVNDLGDDPEGTEFTLELFNNTTSTNDIEFAGQFFPEDLIGPINALTPVSASDPECEVNALRALGEAVDDKEKGDVWLFTDGDTYQNPSVEAIQQLLNENELRASVALTGVCAAKSDALSDRQPFSTELLEGLTPEEQQTLVSEHLTLGKARGELGLLADEVPGGLVPYLLTAINSGGQFLYVDPSQVDNAADILLAQITNSAGAGRWSDYVSDQATYRYDSLASWEYRWIDARAGTNRGNPDSTHKIDVPIPGNFQYFSGPYYNAIHVFEDGYVTLGSHEAYVSANTTLPTLAEPNSALYPYWDNIRPYCPPTGESSPSFCEGYIYTLEDGDWYALEYYKYEIGATGVLNNFEILFNLETGEIRFQYQTVPNGAGGATIGLENSNGTEGIQVSYNDVGGASDGMGYKFVPAPPQPTKTYTVAVDSSMGSVGFLLAGYSGSFEPLEITDPVGTLVHCSDPGTLCLDLDLVQYVQVNTNGRTGDWHATVDAGSTGSGTFTFTSMAASPIAVESENDHTLPIGAQQILVRLAGQVDNCALSGLFHTLDGTASGNSFALLDDGLHNDGAACDGLFGSASFNQGAGSVYLTLTGFHNGEGFTRIDPVPYTFQPLEMISLGDGANFGGFTELQFQVENKDSHDHCYWVSYNAPEGWWIDFPILPMVCVDAGVTETNTFDVYMTSGTSNSLPSGTSGIITISLTELQKGVISDSASARITRHRQPYSIDIFNPTHELRPNGDQAILEFFITDAQGVAVADGTEFHLITNNGDIDPVITETHQGSVVATYTSGSLGSADILAETLNGVTAATQIQIINPPPNQVNLWVSDYQLPADGVSTATLVATVRDYWGNPVANQQVQIGVEGDGQHGSIDGGEVASGITDGNGRFSATFTSGVEAGKIGVRAEVMVMEAGEMVVAQHDRQVMYIGIMLSHLPLIRR